MDWIVYFTAFIICAIAMYRLARLIFTAKQGEPVNRVHFYVRRERGNRFTLWVGKTISSSFFVFADWFFKEFNLNPDDFADMKEGEIREVFINLED